MKKFSTWLENKNSEKKKFVQSVMNKYGKKMPPIDKERYTSLEDEGLEGPIMLKSGKVVYYDPKEGKYYDRDSDMYMSDEDYMAHEKSESVEQAEKVIAEITSMADVQKTFRQNRLDLGVVGAETVQSIMQGIQLMALKDTEDFMFLIRMLRNKINNHDPALAKEILQGARIMASRAQQSAKRKEKPEGEESGNPASRPKTARLRTRKQD